MGAKATGMSNFTVGAFLEISRRWELKGTKSETSEPRIWVYGSCTFPSHGSQVYALEHMIKLSNNFEAQERMLHHFLLTIRQNLAFKKFFQVEELAVNRNGHGLHCWEAGTHPKSSQTHLPRLPLLLQQMSLPHQLLLSRQSSPRAAATFLR